MFFYICFNSAWNIKHCWLWNKVYSLTCFILFYFYPAASLCILTWHEPLTNGRLTLKKKSASQTPRNINTAHSFLWSRKSSKSVWSCVFAPRLPPGGTPLIKPTDCTLYQGELPQTGVHCKQSVCLCVSSTETITQIKLRHKGKHLRQENTCKTEGPMIQWQNKNQVVCDGLGSKFI